MPVLSKRQDVCFLSVRMCKISALITKWQSPNFEPHCKYISINNFLVAKGCTPFIQIIYCYTYFTIRILVLLSVIFFLYIYRLHNKHYISMFQIELWIYIWISRLIKLSEAKGEGDCKRLYWPSAVVQHSPT